MLVSRTAEVLMRGRAGANHPRWLIQRSSAHCKIRAMARKLFAFLRHGQGHTDPVVGGDHIEEKEGRLVLVDEHGSEVYSVEASKGAFVELPSATSGPQ